MAGKVVLTVEAVGAAEGSDIEVENLHNFNKNAPLMVLAIAQGRVGH
jgi:hypothetical protein